MANLRWTPWFYDPLLTSWLDGCGVSFVSSSSFLLVGYLPNVIDLLLLWLSLPGTFTLGLDISDLVSLSSCLSSMLLSASIMPWYKVWLFNRSTTLIFGFYIFGFSFLLLSLNVFSLYLLTLLYYVLFFAVAVFAVKWLLTLMVLG